MKSIYDEALEMLNEVLLVNKKTSFTLGLPLSFEIDIDNFLYQALKQAKKQEKLLGHYKDLAEVRKELYDLTINFKQSNKDRMIVLFTQETLVSNIIKEIENE